MQVMLQEIITVVLGLVPLVAQVINVLQQQTQTNTTNAAGTIYNANKYYTCNL